jgi:hypothetical protein
MALLEMLEMRELEEMPQEKSRQDVSRWGNAVPSNRLVKYTMSIKADVISLTLELS